MENGQSYPFSLLFGISLSDQSCVGSGNLRVFPGSHFILSSPYKNSVLQRVQLPREDIDVGLEVYIKQF